MDLEVKFSTVGGFVFSIVDVQRLKALPVENASVARLKARP
jgi:hypothetical protein